MGRHHVKLRLLIMLWLMMFVGVWIVYLRYNGSEICRGESAKSFICDNYDKGVISGSMCKDLCENKVRLDICLSKDPHYQVYEGTLLVPTKGERNMDVPVYIKQKLNPLDNHFSKPVSGSSMEDFRIMLSAFLKMHLGEGKYDGIQSYIINIADVNNDGKVSLPEARSMWALLQEKDFLMMMVLGTSDYIPQIKGFCGNMYIMESLLSYRLYGADFPQVVDYLLPESFSLYLKRMIAPPWVDRAHIVVGLLEFVEEIIDGPTGNLYMCNVDERDIGYTAHSDIKLLKLDGLLTEEAVQTTLRERSCTAAEDCTMGENCKSICESAATGKCSGEIIQPNLQHVCVMLSNYILDDAPPDIQTQLVELLEKCKALEKTNKTMQMVHSLVLNNLKSLLWKQVSHLKKFSKVSRP